MQQDLPFASAAAAHAIVDKLGATAGKSGLFEFGPSALLGFRIDYTYLEWGAVRGTRGTEPPHSSGKKQLAEQM